MRAKPTEDEGSYDDFEQFELRREVCERLGKCEHRGPYEYGCASKLVREGILVFAARKLPFFWPAHPRFVSNSIGPRESAPETREGCRASNGEVALFVQ